MPPDPNGQLLADPVADRILKAIEEGILSNTNGAENIVSALRAAADVREIMNAANVDSR